MVGTIIVFKMSKLVVLLSVFVFPLLKADYGFDTKYVEVPLDHFSFTTNTTFSLKYLVNDTFYSPGGPIFFYTGNEGDIEMFAQNSGFIFDIAPQFKALIVFAEHRYYGESLPFGNLSYTSPEYLGYLSSTQALADFVYLINVLQNTNTRANDIKKPPVVAFGGSYGGMLSAWLKMKYPNSVVGAIASSAPIWMFKDQNPCNTFYAIVTSSFKELGGDNCVNTVRKSWAIVRSYTQTEAGKQELSKLWNLCSALEAEGDVNTLVNWLYNIYPFLVEVNYPYPNNFLVPLPANPVSEFCSRVNESEYSDDISLLTALGDAVQIYTNYTGTTECNNIFKTADKLGENGWGFQSCTEMLMPLCSTDSDMFVNYDYNFQAISDRCYQQYGVRPRSEDIPILEYGGKDLSTAKNIVFSNGRLDPWSGYGVLEQYSSDIIAVVISEGVHHSDLRASNENDPASVQSARQIHIAQITKWLDEYRQRN